VIEKNETKASAKPEGKLKIGQVSQLSGETAATIRYWTKQGLLKPAGFSPGGYYLYNQEILELIKNIRQMQKEQRLSLEEIKKAIE
jgi:MerR family Zn(II)-responsive transcriptional regulator of zntA